MVHEGKSQKDEREPNRYDLYRLRCFLEMRSDRVPERRDDYLRAIAMIDAALGDSR